MTFMIVPSPVDFTVNHRRSIIRCRPGRGLFERALTVGNHEILDACHSQGLEVVSCWVNFATNSASP